MFISWGVANNEFTDVGIKVTNGEIYLVDMSVTEINVYLQSSQKMKCIWSKYYFVL